MSLFSCATGMGLSVHSYGLANAMDPSVVSDRADHSFSVFRSEAGMDG